MATSTRTEASAQTRQTLNRPLVWLQRVVELFRATLPINLAATGVVVVLDFWSAPRISWGLLLSRVCTIFVFSSCISLLVATAINLAGPYFAARRSLPDLLWLALLIAAAGALGCVAASLLVVMGGLYPIAEFFAIVKSSLKMSVLISLIFGLSSFFYEKVKSELEATQLQLRTRQLEEERARKLALAAQLRSLESRLRPHLLFNTLNSISALIREDPERAELMIERLAALLRFSLDASERNTVPLRAEAKIVRDYLELERVRFGERLRFKLEIPDELLQLEVPPFCLQTLVENSVKYAVSATRVGAEVRVKAETDESSLKLTVSDDGPGFSAAAIISGHGLDILQARLVTLYGAQAALDIRCVEAWTIVTVSLPLHTK